MNPNPNKVKLFLFLAILVAIALVVVNVALVISIHSLNEQIDKQNSIITQQEQTLNYYEQK